MNSALSSDAVSVGKRCPRCNGLLVVTLLESDPSNSIEPLFSKMWRCLNCGTLLDPKILSNQSLRTKRDSVSDVSSADATDDYE